MSRKTSGEYLEEVRSILGSVPSAGQPFVCPHCLGPLDGAWEHCYPCSLIFAEAPGALAGCSIAITTAPMPGPWYARLAAYKNTQPRELLPVLASVAWRFVHENRERIMAALGGDPDLVVPVPSTRGFNFEQQPLRKVAALIQPWRDLVIEVARHDSTQLPRRQAYQPQLFQIDGSWVVGKRVIILEDTWVSGAHLVSLAGGLLVAGATSVLMLSIARAVNTARVTGDHPYSVAMRRPYSEHDWPRP